jgi:hypothetical protein
MKRLGKTPDDYIQKMHITAGFDSGAKMLTLNSSQHMRTAPVGLFAISSLTDQDYQLNALPPLTRIRKPMIAAHYGKHPI